MDMPTTDVTWYRVDSLWNADLFAYIDVWVAPHGRLIVNDDIPLVVKERRRESVRFLEWYAGLVKPASAQLEHVRSVADEQVFSVFVGEG